jgi:hypothetical protein
MPLHRSGLLANGKLRSPADLARSTTCLPVFLGQCIPPGQRVKVRDDDNTAKWFRAGGTRTVRSMRPKSSSDFCNWVLQHRRSQQQGCGEPLRAFDFTIEICITPNPLFTGSAPTMQDLPLPRHICDTVRACSRPALAMCFSRRPFWRNNRELQKSTSISF